VRTVKTFLLTVSTKGTIASLSMGISDTTDFSARELAVSRTLPAAYQDMKYPSAHRPKQQFPPIPDPQSSSSS
jgi:hypothetical protein